MEQTLVPDTYSFIKNMAAAGMPEPVAQAFVENYTKHLAGNLATKHDIAVEIAKLETRLITALGETKTSLIKWIVGTMLGTILSVVALALAFAPYLRQ